MFRDRACWVRFTERFKLLRTQTRSYSTNTINNGKSNSRKPTVNDNDIISEKVESNVSYYDERYKQLENMDFMTAAKMLFTDPPKKKKFGLDFHLVQLFFALMPSLAVYLVAQYSRYEMRKMDVKRKLKEEEEAKEREKEMELNLPKEKEAITDPQILIVKERLDKLEEAVKEIVVESKKQSSSKPNHDEKKHLESSVPRSDNRDSTSNKAEDKDHLNKHDTPKLKPEFAQESLKHSVADANASPRDQKGQNQS